MRADRLLSILMLLQVNRRVTAGDLAERLDVSQRTIYRDMEALGTAGVPVYAERGANGGWSLVEEYRTDLTGLNGVEVQALFLATSPHLLADLGLGRASEAALTKLLAALPSGRRHDAESARQRVHADGSGWHRPDEPTPFLQALQDAVTRERKVDLTYERSDGTTVERLVDPLGLVAKGSVWYLAASVDGEPRTYRVSRVRGALVTDQSCVRPDGFELAAYWDESTARFKAALPSYDAVVRVSPSILPRVRQSGRFPRPLIVREAPPGPDGWVELDLRFDVVEEAREYTLGLGPQLEVIEPGELREQVTEASRATAALYAQRPCAPLMA